MSIPSTPEGSSRWYHGITSYQWFVLAVASAGWVFDIYEGQIFNITRGEMLAQILQTTKDDPLIRWYGDVFVGIFLVGGAVGGILFGMLADRWGRTPMLSATILMYSVFSGLTYFVDSLWQVAVLRFLVAVGTGGEWSVGAALVAEVFPQRARAQAGAMFHASSILGTWMAGIVGWAVAAEWRTAYLIGVLPALLILLVRARMHEPAAWLQNRGDAGASGDGLLNLLTHPVWGRRALLGLLFAATGLGTFWGVTVAGQNLTEGVLLRQGVEKQEAEGQAKLAYGVVQATGGGLGLLAFGPLAVRLGRRGAFLAMQLASIVIVPITCYVPTTYTQMLVLLPLFGFFTLGIHAGYAIYFPELFPARWRATAAGFCFNGGRLVAALVLVFSGWLKALPGMDLRLAVTLLSGLSLVGAVLICFLPETRGQPLPE